MVVGIGIPIKILHEAQGLTVTLELKTGQVYRGKLYEVEDNMNIQLKEVTVTARNGTTSLMETVFLRGSSVRFFILPDNLRHAPMLQTKSIHTNAALAGLPGQGNKPSVGLAGKARGVVNPRGRSSAPGGHGPR